jgi:SAM-dependent methyltransferase
MHCEIVSIDNREARSRFIAERFRPFIRGRVLDVGCDRAHLKRLVDGLDYVGIDVGGTPDLVVNLERERLPFPDRDFDFVLCSDVLEHLDNLHQTFGELVRVARGTIVVSLPNNHANARRPIERGRGSIGHYGLPLEAPVDRHKWFFSLGEAAAFLGGQVGRHPVELVELFAIEKPRPAILRGIRRLRYGTEAYGNRYAHSVWAVFRRKAA